MESRNRLYKMLKPTNADTPAEPKTRSVIMKKLHAERQVERRQQRDKLIQENRVKTLTTSNIKSNTSSISKENSSKFENDSKATFLANLKTKPSTINKSTNQSKSNVLKPVSSSIPNITEDSALLGSTFTVDQTSNISSNLSNMGTFSTNGRKKLLDEWRSKKKEKEKQNASKPAFKAGSAVLTVKTNGKAPTLPTSSTFNFHMTMTSSINHSTVQNSALNQNNKKNSNLTSAVSRPVSRSNSARLPLPKETPKLSSNPTRNKLTVQTTVKQPITKQPVNSKKDTIKGNDLSKDIDLITKKIDSSIKIDNGSLSKLTNGKIISNPKITTSRNNQIENAENITINIKNEEADLFDLDKKDLNSLDTKENEQTNLNETRLDSVKPNHTSSPIKRPVLDQQEEKFNADYFEKIDLDKRDVKYYRSLVNYNTFFLNRLSNDWNILCLNGAIPEDIQGDIRSACGLAKLLIDERFFQFNDLINQCEQSKLKSSEVGLVVKCSDLQGFWDMVDVQVKDVTKKFEILEKIKLNNYVKPLDIIQSQPAVDSKQTKTNFIKNKNYLRKKDQKQENAAESSEQVETNNQIVEKPKPKPNFSEFRAKMKAMKQQSIEKEKSPEIVIQVSELKPKTPKVVDFEKENKDSPRKSTRRRSIKPILPSTDQIETKKYNLRSRPSDLIKFDSPDVLKTNHLENEISTLPTQTPFTLKKNRKKSIFHDIKENEVLDLEGKEEKDEFFTFDDNTELWKSRPSIYPQNQYNTPSKTPAKLSINRDSLDIPKFTNITNSPLLKIALISSQSKRLSINTLNRLFD